MKKLIILIMAILIFPIFNAYASLPINSCYELSCTDSSHLTEELCEADTLCFWNADITACYSNPTCFSLTRDGESTCESTSDDLSCFWVPETSVCFALTIPLCGNGITDVGETCDDGNTTSDDGCNNLCIIEPGCGNGYLEAGEQCDDGNLIDGDNCTSTCQGEPNGCYVSTEAIASMDGSVNDTCASSGYMNGGYLVDNISILCFGRDLAACDTTCTAVEGMLAGDGGILLACEYTNCGNGTEEFLEDCDDGNTTSNDGCSNLCEVELFCGDSIVSVGEECDDGNTTDGDGCTSLCVTEVATPDTPVVSPASVSGGVSGGGGGGGYSAGGLDIMKIAAKKSNGTFIANKDGKYTDDGNFTKMEYTVGNEKPSAPKSTVVKKSKFTDIKGHWAETAINKLYNLDILDETSTKFNPNKLITRLEVAKIASTMYSNGEVDFTKKLTTMPFKDIDKNSSDAPYIKYAVDNNLITGYGDKFYPSVPVARATSLIAIMKGFNVKIDRSLLSSFTDVPSKLWFANYIANAKKVGIVFGYNDGTFKPAGTITRAEIAVITSRLLDYVGSGN